MILVTGSSGHLGEALMRNLREGDDGGKGRVISGDDPTVC